jgi:hypothetical protein
VEAHTQNNASRWTRDRRREGTGGGRTAKGVPENWTKGKKRGKHKGAEARTLAFQDVCLSRPPPHALEVTGDLDKEDRRA